MQVWTVGHSNRGLDDFMAILHAADIVALADVRRFPGSRKWPHFGRDVLSAALAEEGIEYHHFPNLGGRRSKGLEDSPNTAWRVVAFRNYADYMLTDEFAAAFKHLEDLARSKRTAMMCSEALPWRCHRRLLADQFTVLGWQVHDLMSLGKSTEHALPSFARAEHGRLTYPGEQTLFED